MGVRKESTTPGAVILASLNLAASMSMLSDNDVSFEAAHGLESMDASSCTTGDEKRLRWLIALESFVPKACPKGMGLSKLSE